MTISLVRVDDRLIHGQVVMSWIRYINCTAIKIIDDQVASDEFMCSLLCSIAPSGIKLEIVGIEKGAELYPSWVESEENILVLVKTPLTLMSLESKGIQFESINIGGIAICGDRKKFHKNIALMDSERDFLKEKVLQGVEVFYQMITSERRYLFTKKMFKE